MTIEEARAIFMAAPGWIQDEVEGEDQIVIDGTYKADVFEALAILMRYKEPPAEGE